MNLSAERELALNCFPYFRERVCGYRDFQDFHKKVDAVLLSDSRYKRVIIPRNHLKSSDVMAWIVWKILKNPDISVLYETSIYAQALKYLGEIKNHFNSPRFVSLFGSWRGSPWSDNKVMVNQRKRLQVAPTVSASGVDKTQTGQHYDLIVLDDLVDENNSKTKEGREKVIARYQQALSLLRPSGTICVIGTPWDRDDLNGWLDKNPAASALFETVRLDIYDENGAILFPQKFCETIEEERLNPGKRSFESLRAQLGPYQFSCQYRCSPEEEAFGEFKKAWLRHLPKEIIQHRLKHNRGTVRIFVDPAMGREHTKDPCDTAIIIAHFMSDYQIDVLLTDIGRYGPGDTVEKVNDYAMYYAATGELEVMIEDVGGWGTLTWLLEQKRNSCPVHYMISPVRPIGDKDRRIRGLFPFYQAGQINHSEDLRDGKFEDQLYRFPKDSHYKDGIDAFSQFTFAMHWPVKHQPRRLAPEGVPVARPYSRRAPLHGAGSVEDRPEKSYINSRDSLFEIGV